MIDLSREHWVRRVVARQLYALSTSCRQAPIKTLLCLQNEGSRGATRPPGSYFPVVHGIVYLSAISFILTLQETLAAKALQLRKNSGTIHSTDFIKLHDMSGRDERREREKATEGDRSTEENRTKSKEFLTCAGSEISLERFHWPRRQEIHLC